MARRDHWLLWMEYWASAEDMWEVAQQEKERLPGGRERQHAEEQARTAMLADLERSLADLTSRARLGVMF